jgi:hypothetical protein
MRYLLPWLVAAFVFLVLAATSQMLPLVWDEGELIGRAALVKRWGGQVIGNLCGDHAEQSPFSQEAIATSWRSTTVIEGHPGGYLAVIALGRTLADYVPQLPQKTAWRLGPILLMSIALGVMFSTIRRHFDTTAALLAVLAVLLVPRVFAHAHFATCDGVLMAAWLLAVATFPLPQRDGTPQRKGRLVLSGIVWGLCFGLTLAAKFTGWAICAPFLVLGFRLQASGFRLQTSEASHNKTLEARSPKPEVRSLKLPYLVGGCTALLVFYLLNPPLWHRPFTGIADFFYLNTHRNQFNVSILFWGRMYDLDHSLPWYNTLVWAAITFPTLFFAMLPFGVSHMFSRSVTGMATGNGFHEMAAGNGAQRSDRTGTASHFSWLIVLNALVLLIARAIPGTPPHDGVRLFVAAFPFLAIIAGIGMSQLWQRSGKRLVGRLTVVLVLVAGMSNLVFYAPQWLSFYNAVIGGVNGASRKGFEPTYYWDALDAEVIATLNVGTRENEKICFTPAKKSITLDLVRAWDGLRPAFRPDAPGEYRWYVFQNRPSGLTKVDRILLRDFEPTYIKYVSQPTLFSNNPLQTPVLYVFSYDDYLAAFDLVKPD